MKVKIVIIVISVVIIGLIVYNYLKSKPKSSNSIPYETSGNLTEHFTVHNFTIHNHLNKDITVNCGRLSKNVSAKNSAMLSQDDVIKYLVNGRQKEPAISVYVGNQKYCDYMIDTASNTQHSNIRIKDLHVGMVTDRSIGSTDSFRSTVTNANAVRGQTHVYIHNLSAMPLDLQVGSVTYHIEPYEVYTYKGYLHMGVALGTIFTDVNALYDDYVYLKPFSNIYYGLTSDKLQPNPGEGCNQYTFYDSCERGQTLWPFEEGIY